MPEEEPKKYGKPKMICPFCQEKRKDGSFRPFATGGMTMHVRMMHPERDDEFQTHREKYVEKFACDEDGVLIGKEPKQEPVSKVNPVVIEEEVIPEQEYVELEEPEEIVKPTPPSTPPSTPPPVKIPAKQVPKPQPKKEPESPKKEEFPDEREPERSIYNPYGYQ